MLVVDDDKGLQETLGAILEHEGYLPVVAGDGIDALEKLEAEKPALILLDIMMPRLDGYGFADELRRRGIHRAIPIVVLTADGRARQKAEQVGADGYLEKPFSIDALMHEMERLIGS